jgi:ABC-2 type transport system ATP-binding protein
VDDLTFTIAPGEVVGIAGPNGAGKSTIVALMIGLIRATDGRITLDGLSPRIFAERVGVGYLPELIPLNPQWRADDALRRMAVLAGVPSHDVEERIDAVIEQVGLTEHRRKRCRQLSKGNLQKVGLAQTLLRDEQVYVFDEPTHGLDPVWTQRFREIVTELRRDNRSMLIASHNLDELERLADRVLIIDRGRIQRTVDLRAASADSLSTYRIRAANGAGAVMEAFPGALERGNEVFVPPIDIETLNAGLARAISRGALVAGVQPGQSALEREFHEAVRTRTEEES